MSLDKYRCCKGGANAKFLSGQSSSNWGHLEYLKEGEEIIADEKMGALERIFLEGWPSVHAFFCWPFQAVEFSQC